MDWRLRGPQRSAAGADEANECAVSARQADNDAAVPHGQWQVQFRLHWARINGIGIAEEADVGRSGPGAVTSERRAEDVGCRETAAGAGQARRRDDVLEQHDQEAEAAVAGTIKAVEQVKVSRETEARATSGQGCYYCREAVGARTHSRRRPGVALDG